MATEITKTTNGGKGSYIIAPPVDIYETESEYVITADMPGVKKEDLDITYHKNTIDIRGRSEGSEPAGNTRYREFRLYDYHRSFTVGNDVDGEKIAAGIENGVLTLHLPKREEAKPKKIAISVN